MGQWKGGLTVTTLGYVARFQSRGRYAYEHRLIVEGVIGHPLPKRAVVHHVNERRSDNANRNLVALQSQAEHRELHRKMLVRAAGGDPWRDRLCSQCGPKPAAEFYAFRRSQYPNGEVKSWLCKVCFGRAVSVRSKAWRETRKNQIAVRGVLPMPGDGES